MSRAILPGATLGILGGGQLGRMLAMVARRMGYRIHVMTTEEDAPASQIADATVLGPLEDPDLVARFASQVDVVTLEFENIPHETATAIDRHAPVRPGGHVLHTTQHRLREKTFLRDAGVPTARFAAVDSSDDLNNAIAHVGLPCVLKTAAWGYDGQGQRIVRSPEEAQQAWLDLGRQTLIAEQFVDFEGELSIVAVRNLDGQFVAYGPIWNEHSRHILDISVCPAGLPESTARDAVEMARAIMERLEVVGVLCVEYFLDRSGHLRVNELAPRPHNSGHLTIEGHATSQFEQQLRAVCGLPLGSAIQDRPAAMANLLGDLWTAREPAWTRCLALPDTYLHLYGKQTARAGRKMGHITALGGTPDEARRLAENARTCLSGA
jgi:5-(carboxyamino)imidazole ribonucleotide synthase